MPDLGTAPALVVGGTGMLAGVVRGLVAEGVCTAVVARRRSRIEAVAGGAVLPVTVDYREPERLRAGLLQARRELGPFGTAILWVHTPSRDTVLPVVADVLAEDALVVDVRGSAVAEPASAAPLQGGRRWRTVVLGFADGPAGTRWLTHQEITAGVLAEVRAPGPSGACRVVGRVRPWSDRPG